MGSRRSSDPTTRRAGSSFSGRSRTTGPKFRAACGSVPGIAPLDRHDVARQEALEANPGFEENAQFRDARRPDRRPGPLGVGGQP